MGKPFNKLTPAQVELLALVAEEAAEVQQAVCKILRHGFECFNPNDRHKTTNRELLENELGDLTAVVEMFLEAGLADRDRIADAEESKRESIGMWLHHHHEVSSDETLKHD